MISGGVYGIVLLVPCTQGMPWRWPAESSVVFGSAFFGSGSWILYRSFFGGHWATKVAALGFFIPYFLFLFAAVGMMQAIPDLEYVWQYWCKD